MNIHLLKHHVKNWGPLWSYSCFGFESVNRDVKKLFHGIRDMSELVNTIHHNCVHSKEMQCFCSSSDDFQLQCGSKSSTCNKVDVTSLASINQKDHWRKEMVQLTVTMYVHPYAKYIALILRVYQVIWYSLPTLSEIAQWIWMRYNHHSWMEQLYRLHNIHLCYVDIIMFNTGVDE